MPEKREQDDEYLQQACEQRGCVWEETSNPKERSEFIMNKTDTEHEFSFPCVS